MQTAYRNITLRKAIVEEMERLIWCDAFIVNPYLSIYILVLGWKAPEVALLLEKQSANLQNIWDLSIWVTSKYTTSGCIVWLWNNSRAYEL